MFYLLLIKAIREQGEQLHIFCIVWSWALPSWVANPSPKTVKTKTALLRCDTCAAAENSGFCNILRRDLQIFNGVFQFALSSHWTPHMQNMHTTTTRHAERERGRLSACSAVLAGFHIILCRSCPSTGKFSEITSFNYLLPTAAAAAAPAGWRYTDAGWDSDSKNASTPGTALILWLLLLNSPRCHHRRHRPHCESPKNIDLHCSVCALTYRLAGAGWVLACHNRKTLHFQSGEPPFLSPPPHVPATPTQPFTCAKSLYAHGVTCTLNWLLI